MSELSSNSEPTGESLQPETKAARRRFNTLAMVLFVALIGTIVYLVGWSWDLAILAGMTVAVGVGTVVINRRRRKAVAPSVDELERPKEVPNIVDRLGSFIFLLVSVLFDLLFLVGWSLANHYGEILLSKWHVEDQFSFNVLLWCFRISTLVPIVTFIAADLIRIVRRLLKIEFGKSD